MTSSSRRKSETSNSSSKGKGNGNGMVVVTKVQNNDVLFGKGCHLYTHSGNRILREIILRRKDDYMNAERDDKNAVATQVLKEFLHQKGGGRFLRALAEKKWELVNDKKALEKIKQAFRDTGKSSYGSGGINQHTRTTTTNTTSGRKNSKTKKTSKKKPKRVSPSEDSHKDPYAKTYMKTYSNQGIGSENNSNSNDILVSESHFKEEHDGYNRYSRVFHYYDSEKGGSDTEEEEDAQADDTSTSSSNSTSSSIQRRHHRSSFKTRRNATAFVTTNSSKVVTAQLTPKHRFPFWLDTNATNIASAASSQEWNWIPADTTTTSSTNDNYSSSSRMLQEEERPKKRFKVTCLLEDDDDDEDCDHDKVEKVTPLKKEMLEEEEEKKDDGGCYVATSAIPSLERHVTP